jgi:hypothetical protein
MLPDARSAVGMQAGAEPVPNRFIPPHIHDAGKPVDAGIAGPRSNAAVLHKYVRMRLLLRQTSLKV